MHAHTDSLLHYRPWRGSLRGPLNGTWAMARTALGLMFRRRLFWGLYALGLMIFFFFFYAQYLVYWVTLQTANESVRVAGMPVKVGEITTFLTRLNLKGNAHTYGNFIWFEGYVVMIVLALAGSVLVGNDFQHGSLPFYLSKPIRRWHYVLGKAIAIGTFINLLTTVPALVLFVEAGLLDDLWDYTTGNPHLLLGILGYGAVLTVSLSLILIASAVWLRRTVPLVMVWSGVFVLTRSLSAWLVDGQKFHERWRLIDLWNDLYLLGLWCLRVDPESIRPQPQPTYLEAALTVGAVCAVCLIYLRRRIQAVEIIS
jgi:ABC-type transport system involved in multi-copper enzyme maturation permease subunit